MTKAEQKAWKQLAPRLSVHRTIHVQNRPKGGAWFVVILTGRGAGGKAGYIGAVTRHYRGPLPKPADWNARRTAIITETPRTSADEVAKILTGWVWGKWGRWAI